MQLPPCPRVGTTTTLSRPLSFGKAGLSPRDSRSGSGRDKPRPSALPSIPQTWPANSEIGIRQGFAAWSRHTLAGPIHIAGAMDQPIGCGEDSLSPPLTVYRPLAANHPCFHLPTPQTGLPTLQLTRAIEKLGFPWVNPLGSFRHGFLGGQGNPEFPTQIPPSRVGTYFAHPLENSGSGRAPGTVDGCSP